VTEPAYGWLESIRRDWDARALENPRAYINWSDVPDNDEAFFQSGKVDYDQYVKPFLRRMQFDPGDKSVLEIGCGVGRIARWMSQDFARYVGVDVSPEMIRRASANHLPRATFQTVSGGDLTGIASASMDFVFSFAVFQHVPNRDAIFNYFAETARVLKPGGIFRLHMKGLASASLGRWALEAGLAGEGRPGSGSRVKWPFVRIRKLDTWQGSSVSPSRAIAQCSADGLEVVETAGRWTVMMWIGGKKPQREADGVPRSSARVANTKKAAL
jgi:SAM-dependent methyltransferase